MVTNNDILEILQELKKRTKNINPIDVIIVESQRKGYKVFPCKSRERKDGRRNTFLYLRLPDSKNFIEGLLGTSGRQINDREHITKPSHGFAGFPIRFIVTPKDFTDDGITYDDIEDLILQCYQTLNKSR